MRKLYIGFFLPILLFSCIENKSIDIGFVGDLTGPNSVLGMDGRDGAILAVEEINAEGGIHGQLLVLHVRDDKSDPAEALSVNKELSDSGVVAIIGHSTSTQVYTVLNQVNEQETVLIGYTTASDLLSNQQDYFFRVQPATDYIGRFLAEKIYEMGYRKIGGIIDLSNLAYSERQWIGVSSVFKELGGSVEEGLYFDPNSLDYEGIMREASDLNIDSLFFICTSQDTALLAQHGRRLGMEQQYFGVSWNMTDILIEKGGRSVEEMILVSHYAVDSPDPAILEFKEHYYSRFHREASFPAMLGYEAVQLLFLGLMETGGKKENLNTALINLSVFPGVMNQISINEYGDAEREIYLVEVKNGQFKELE